MNILITRHDKIGDFITALPLAKVLKEQTNYRIIFLLSKINEPLAKHLPFIDDIIVYTQDTKELVKRIKSKQIDLSISCYIDNHLGISLVLAGIKTRIAPATKLAQIFFNKTLKQNRSKVEKTEWQYNIDLLTKLDKNLDLSYTPPILNLNSQFSNFNSQFIIFHPGFGGSSDGNLTYEDYWKLIVEAKKYCEVYITFGPDDKEAKNFFKEKIKKISILNSQFSIKIRDDFSDIWEFTKFIALSKLFISTSTGPMHLAGLTNTKTLSFFGDNLFASSKRWATVSDEEKQNNFEIPLNYTKEFYGKIERRLVEIISNEI